MPPTPSRAGAADGDAPAAVTRGASALRDFLARESHARGSRADPRAFADWLEDETFARIRSDEAFALRAYANGLRRRHAALLDPLLAAVADAEAAYDASDDAARIRAAATDVERANAAVAGIRRFLDDPPRAEAEATTKNDAKRLATRAKLDAFLARLPIAERHLNDVRASSELHRARADARAALAEAREAVGLADAEAAAAEASRIFGGDVVDKGKSFETTCEAIVRDFLHRDPNAFRSSSLDREEGDLWLLRNVTLGMAAGRLTWRWFARDATIRRRSSMPSRATATASDDALETTRRPRARGMPPVRIPSRRPRLTFWPSWSASVTPTTSLADFTRGRPRSGGSPDRTTIRRIGGIHDTPRVISCGGTIPCASRRASPSREKTRRRRGRAGEKTPSRRLRSRRKVFGGFANRTRTRGVLLARALVHHARADDDGDGRQGTRDEKEVRRDSIAVRVRPHAAPARSRLARAGFLFEKFAPRADVSGAR